MKKTTKLNILTIASLVLGIIMGLKFPNFMQEISFVGTIYVNLLKLMIIPIIFTSVAVAIYGTKGTKGKIVLKTIILFVIMFVATFLITSLIVFLLDPTKGITSFQEVAWSGSITSLKPTDIIVNLFPNNLATMIEGNFIFACILFAFAFGKAAMGIKDAEKIMSPLETLRDIIYRILRYIMYLTPIAVFSLIGTTIANYGTQIVGIGLKYIGIAYLCSIITLILIMILPVWIIAKVNPITYIKRVYKVWIVTITTCSSAATLPYTIKTCNEEFNIPEKITNIVVPLGCTIHMCGGAVSFALLGIFCSQLFGIEITLTTFLVMLISSTLINMSAPGIPGGGIVLGATYLTLLNIPLSFIGLYSGIYRFLDMSYTTLNVTGDITANILIDYQNKK